jgi:hypothetical protein
VSGHRRDFFFLIFFDAHSFLSLTLTVVYVQSLVHKPTFIILRAPPAGPTLPNAIAASLCVRCRRREGGSGLR